MALSEFHGELSDAVDAALLIDLLLREARDLRSGSIRVFDDSRRFDIQDLRQALRGLAERRAERDQLLKSAADLSGAALRDQIATLRRKGPPGLTEYASLAPVLLGCGLGHRLETLGRRGGAAKATAGALTGWTVRELDRAVPATCQNRYSVIRRLLLLADIDASSQKVRAIVMKGRT
jgi:hypothetical protein